MDGPPSLAIIGRRPFRIALINPPNSRPGRLAEPNAAPPLGLASIAASLRAEGFVADLFDFGDVLAPDGEFLARIGLDGYDLYGFTSYTKTFAAALDLLHLVRERNPTTAVVFGGPHATPCAAEVLRRQPAVDFVIRNDGELPMVALCRHLRDGTPALAQVGNLVFRANTGEIAFNESCTELPALDNLPFPARDWKLEPRRDLMERRRSDMPVETVFLSSSRGCPKRCTFCSIIVMNPKYRYRSVDSLMAELKLLYAERQFGHVAFHDANFFVHIRRTLEFARALHAWRPEITWSATATADSIARHADVLEEIGRLNCLALEVGIENGSESVLRRFNKGTTIADNLAALQLIERAGILLEMDYIMFDPEATLEELRDNRAFLVANELTGRHPNEHLYNALKVYPGTPARERYIRMFDLDPEGWETLLPPFLHPEAATVFENMIAFGQRVQPRIDDAVTALDGKMQERLAAARCSGSRAEAEAAQRLASVVIRLRHVPDRFFEEVLSKVGQRSLPLGTSFEELADMGSLAHARKVLDEAGELLGNPIELPRGAVPSALLA